MKTNILITGSTGIIGRELLYEFLYRMYNKESDGKLVLLIRKSGNMTAVKRLNEILRSPYRPVCLRDISIEWMLDRIIVIEGDLNEPGENGYKVISDLENLHVIHLAASTNLSNTKEAEEEVSFTNYQSTLSFLKRIVPCIAKFVYLGTAYSCGYKAGIISDDFLSSDRGESRNPYEELKVKTEKEVVEICEKHNVKWQILRPSIVCGRLLEKPYYYIPRFNVFYAFGNFFDIIGRSSRRDFPVRLHVNTDSGLNIVSSDYVARAIAEVYRNDQVMQLNIANTHNVPNPFVIGVMMHRSGIRNYSFTPDMPQNLNIIEKMYYKSVGQHFTSYLNTPVYSYDTRLLRSLLGNTPEPDVRKYFGELYDYALIHGFQEPSVSARYESVPENICELAKLD